VNGDNRPHAAYLAGTVQAGRLDILHRRLLAVPGYGLALRLLARTGLGGRGLVIALPYLWLTLFFLVPFLIVLKISFAEAALAQPPFTSLVDYVNNLADGGTTLALNFKFNLYNYATILSDDLYIRAYLSSVRIAAISTVLCLLVWKVEPSQSGE